MKYYFNTQNVTKGLADLNPYILGGFHKFTEQPHYQAPKVLAVNPLWDSTEAQV